MSDISIYVTSTLTSSERRISPQWTLKYLKAKLELITGISPRYQTIYYYPIANTNEHILVSDANNYNAIEDDGILISKFNFTQFSRLHVEDMQPDSELKQLEQSNVNDEYNLPEEVYENKSDSVLNWKKQNQLGRFNPNFQQEKSKVVEENNRIAEKIKVGDRFRNINIQGERRGVVRFLGKVDVLDKGESMWVGVEFDEPVGKNNGMIDNQRFFECREKCGSFLRPKQVEIGDFPELDPFASDNDDDEI